MNTASRPPDPRLPLAVLVSGGLDSAILVAEAALAHPAVVPLYVRFGLSWEPVEEAHLRRFLDRLAHPAVRPLVVLHQPVADLYGRHWSLGDADAPGADSPDEAVYLPGRNLLLVTKGGLWCHLSGVPQLALAPLCGNPFPDATPSFFAACEGVLNQSVGGAVRVVRPFAHLSKVEVLRRGQGLPLEWTFSCIRPADGRHCGRCNKCAERQRGFASAGLPDPTPYANVHGTPPPGTAPAKKDAACSA